MAYQHWSSTPQPDPRTAPQQAIIDALVEIVAAEGPVTVRRAYLLVLRAAGFNFWRVASIFRGPLDRALKVAIQQDRIAAANPDKGYWIDQVLHRPGSPPVRMRDRGDRTLYEIPKDEVAELLRRLQELAPTLHGSALKRAVLDAYGLQRLTGKALSYLDACLRLTARGEQRQGRQ